MKLLTDLEIEKRLTDFPDWDYHEKTLSTEFEFDNFKNCMSAMMRIAFECEKLNQHPELDFELAKFIEEIVEVE